MFIEFCPGGALDDVISGVVTIMTSQVAMVITAPPIIIYFFYIELEKGLNETQIKCVTHQMFVVSVVVIFQYTCLNNIE